MIQTTDLIPLPKPYPDRTPQLSKPQVPILIEPESPNGLSNTPILFIELRKIQSDRIPPVIEALRLYSIEYHPLLKPKGSSMLIRSYLIFLRNRIESDRNHPHPPLSKFEDPIRISPVVEPRITSAFVIV